MKKTGLLHSELNKVISAMGHGDMLVIADNGLPIPPGVNLIDLALRPGTVSFEDTLQTIAEELVIESYVVATELKETNSTLLNRVQQIVDKPYEFVLHTDFKKMSERAVTVIRTGEWTPYANVILVAGVPF
ncbi:D-ribose pyranase [Neobacillus sp. PS3-12]|uniref:D-ribose pyranase n=1 Tax=Neobacillus sp. PS3-12 TaxID=3070677 RepID=UPI0027E0E635|nr:D-ribose pyranase [Neobacillus sp. PS3-12]WML55082.1 D-ribose pyranase [Neobacillus sp. PS3-12]